MNETIESAIQERHMLQFHYGGGLRTVEPFCLGLSRANSLVLCAYQTAGHSNSNPSLGWRLFRVGDMKDLTMMAERFSRGRPGYNPDDSRMTKIVARFS